LGPDGEAHWRMLSFVNAPARPGSAEVGARFSRLGLWGAVEELGGGPWWSVGDPVASGGVVVGGCRARAWDRVVVGRCGDVNSAEGCRNPCYAVDGMFRMRRALNPGWARVRGAGRVGQDWKGWLRIGKL
jgi:hypothetical protein